MEIFNRRFFITWALVSSAIIENGSLASAATKRRLSSSSSRKGAKEAIKGAPSGKKGSSSKSASSQKQHVIFSTDCSGGLYGPNAGFDECPAVAADGGVNGPVAFRDIDDLMAITLAINNGDDVIIDAIVPIFGDASMRANVLTGVQLVHELKCRTDILVVPGAATASQPTFIDTWRFISDIDEAGWGAPLPVAQTQKPNAPDGSGGTIDPLHLFKISCMNTGVQTIKDKLIVAADGEYTVHLLGIGPMTDYACLLLHSNDEALRAIVKLILLIGQEAGKPFGSAGATGRDFNVVMDPLAAAIVLSFSDTVRIVLMDFELTRQTTSDSDLVILFNSETFLPDTLPFFVQAKEQARPTEGPFDQYTIAYSLHPDWFDCSAYPTYVIQCNEDRTDELSSTTCTTDTSYSDQYTAGVSAELTIDRSNTYVGKLVIENPNGNILNFKEKPAATVTACTSFSDGGYESFKSFVYDLQ